MNRRSLRNALITTVLVAAIAGIGIYAYQQSAAFIRGPVVTIEGPQDGETFRKQRITVQGSAEHIAYMRLNGRQIYTNQQGVFREALLLAPGYNIITITAEDKFGRTNTQKRALVYKPQSSQ